MGKAAVSKVVTINPRAPTSITIDPALWKEFKVVCARSGHTITHHLERMIRAYVVKRSKAVNR